MRHLDFRLYMFALYLDFTFLLGEVPDIGGVEGPGFSLLVLGLALFFCLGFWLG